MAQGLQKFEIQLDRPDITYSPGDLIKGKLVLELGRPKHFKGLKLKIKGFAEVRWSESEGSGKDSDTVWYRGHEEYFRMENQILIGSASNHVELGPGYHEYPFEYRLPPNIPSSFEGREAHVRYTVKAVIDRPWKFDHETSSTFRVVTQNDVTQWLSSMDVIDGEHTSKFCCFPCISMGAMDIHTHVPKNGYNIGETIVASIHIKNRSRVRITNVELELEQKTKLFASRPRSKWRKHSVRLVSTSKDGPFGGESEIELSLRVPDVPASNLPHCNIIELSYILNVNISVSGCHCSTTNSYPIFIGTGPEITPVFSELPIETNFAPTGLPIGFVYPNTNNVIEQPPPSYEECVKNERT